MFYVLIPIFILAGIVVLFGVVVFLGRFRGSVVTRYRWDAPNRIDVTLEHGIPESLDAWFDIREENGGTRLLHVEEMNFGANFVPIALFSPSKKPPGVKIAPAASFTPPTACTFGR